MAKASNGDKEEASPVDEGATVPVEGEVEVPYSIYTNKEKWMIVAMVALAGFYRYVFLVHLQIILRHRD